MLSAARPSEQIEGLPATPLNAIVRGPPGRSTCSADRAGPAVAGHGAGLLARMDRAAVVPRSGVDDEAERAAERLDAVAVALCHRHATRPEPSCHGRTGTVS